MPTFASGALDVLCVGLSHQTSPLAVRDAVVLNDDEIAWSIRALRERTGAAEVLVLSTCNRTEFYTRGARVADPAMFIGALLREVKGTDLPLLGHPHLYTLREEESVRHLFRVACGLESMVLGEPQILGQVKDASELAARLGGSGPVTERLLHTVLRCAKRARSETSIGRGPVSNAYAGVSLAAKVLGTLGDKRVLLVGAGEMSALAWTHLKEAGVTQFMVANRTRERREAFAEKYCARAVSLEALPVVLPGADIVISATRAANHVVTEPMVRAAMKIRRNRPLFCLDLAVPRDIDPLATKLPNVFLHDLDALGQIVAQSLAQRRAEIPRVEAIVEEELARFQKWHRSLAATPTVTAFRQHFEQVAREELQRHQGRFRPEDRAAAESLAHGIVQKLLHRPTTQLRNAAAGDLEAAARLEAVRDLFGIDGAPAPAPDGLPGRNGPSPDTEGEDDADRNAR
jgi:glutamyl-tRNA reductase